MNLYIITGASKGLGESIARKLISIDNRLFLISRIKFKNDGILLSTDYVVSKVIKLLDMDVNNGLL